MLDEKWLSVVDYEGHYEVSSFGRVRSIDRTDSYGRFRRGRVLKPGRNPKGYLAINLCLGGGRRTGFIHVLVARAFIGPRPQGMEVNHKDGVKANNHACNLEYATPKQNMEHAAANGLLRHNRGEAHHNCKLTQSQVDEIRRLRGVLTQERLAARYGVTHTLIGLIQRNLYWVDDKTEPIEKMRVRGEQHGRARLTEAQARDILMSKGILSVGELAQRYSISRQAIYGIWQGKAWLHLSETVPLDSPA
jgi:hypothetical protein